MLLDPRLWGNRHVISINIVNSPLALTSFEIKNFRRLYVHATLVREPRAKTCLIQEPPFEKQLSSEWAVENK